MKNVDAARGRAVIHHGRRPDYPAYRIDAAPAVAARSLHGAMVHNVPAMATCQAMSVPHISSLAWAMQFQAFMPTEVAMQEIVECRLCGSDVVPEGERSYVLEEHAALCFDCAVRCGGVFDDAQRRWTTLPSLAPVHGAAVESRPRRYRACARVDNADRERPAPTAARR